MRMVKMVLVAGIIGVLASALTFAVPLDITFTGGEPAQIYPGYPLTLILDFKPLFQWRMRRKRHLSIWQESIRLR